MTILGIIVIYILIAIIGAVTIAALHDKTKEAANLALPEYQRRYRTKKYFYGQKEVSKEEFNLKTGEQDDNGTT